MLIVSFFAPACGSTWTGSVGAVLAKNNRTGRVFVRDVPGDMPAARAGIREGDEIVAIDGKPVLSMSADDVHRALAGAVGSRVVLKIARGERELDVPIERGPLKPAAEKLETPLLPATEVSK